MYACLTFNEKEYSLTSPPTACKLKLSSQETLASRTLRPNSSKASKTETSKPGQLFSDSTFIRNPFSRVSTVTCYNHQIESKTN